MDKRGREHLRKALDKNLSCYVLITCDGPSADGQMPVEMTYHGEESLVAYLLEGAQLRIDQDDEEELERITPIRLIK